MFYPCFLLLHALGVLSEYAPLDGVGNNVANPLWGSTGHHYHRLSAVNYHDQIGSVASHRPNARTLSNALFATGPFMQSGLDVSSMVGAFGQFVAHDAGRTESGSESLDFVIPTCDKDMDADCAGTQTHPFTRAQFDATTGTSPTDPRMITNVQTGYIDGAVIYGETVARSILLRTFIDGKLISDNVVGCPLNTAGVNMAGTHISSLTDLRLGGDVRANVNPGILAVHCLFVLEHNRQCDEIIADSSSTLSDQDIYDMARARTVGLYQNVVYKEYLPAVLGEPLPTYTGYNSSINAAPDVFFSAAAYRYGHSGINSVYDRLDENWHSHETGHLVLRDSYFKPDYLLYDGIDPILRGLVTVKESEIDLKMVPDLRNHVEGLQADLAALDIMRGRDFGLLYYNDARASFGLPTLASFSDLTSDLQLIAALESVYNNITMLDAIVGGLIETAEGNSLLGPLFKASFLQQFASSRDGDRFYFENHPELDQATIDQIKSTSLHDIISRNTGVTMTSSAFAYKTRRERQDESEGTSSGEGGDSNTWNSDGFIYLDSSFQLSWTSQTSTIQFTLKVSQTGWIGLGFGTGMTGADMIVATVSAGSPSINDYRGSGNVQPSLDTDSGGSNDIVLISGEEVNGVTTVTFERAYDTGDTQDTALSLGVTDIIFAYGTSDSFSYHGTSNKGKGQVNLALTPTESGFSNTQLDTQKVFIMHGIFMALAWGILCPIALFAVKFFKHNPSWLATHRLTMSIVVSVTMIFGGIALMWTTEFLRTNHGIIGVSLMSIISFQLLMGLCLKKVREMFDRKVMRVFTFVHMWCGRIIVPVAFANIYLGLEILEPEDYDVYKWYITAWVVALSVSMILFAIERKYACCAGKAKSVERFNSLGLWVDEAEGENSNCCNRIRQLCCGVSNRDVKTSRALPTMTMKEFRSQCNKGAPWLIYNNAVVDVTKYQDIHPGGGMILQEYFGKEIQEIFNGEKPVPNEGRIPHSDKALDCLMDLRIATLVVSVSDSKATGKKMFGTALKENAYIRHVGKVVTPPERAPPVYPKIPGFLLPSPTISRENSVIDSSSGTLSGAKVVIHQNPSECTPTESFQTNRSQISGYSCRTNNITHTVVSRIDRVSDDDAKNPVYVICVTIPLKARIDFNDQSVFSSHITLGEDLEHKQGRAYTVLPAALFDDSISIPQTQSLVIFVKRYRNGLTSKDVTSVSAGQTLAVSGYQIRRALLPVLQPVSQNQYQQDRIALYFAGGTGIVTFINRLHLVMCHYEAEQKKAKMMETDAVRTTQKPYPIILFASFASDCDIMCRKTVEYFAESCPYIQVVWTIQDRESNSWKSSVQFDSKTSIQYTTGHFTGELITSVLGERPVAVCHVCGPRRFWRSMNQTLAGINIHDVVRHQS